MCGPRNPTISGCFKRTPHLSKEVSGIGYVQNITWGFGMRGVNDNTNDGLRNDFRIFLISKLHLEKKTLGVVGKKGL